DGAEAGQIENGERTLAEPDQAVAAELRQQLADVHRRQAGGVGDMMLAQRKLDLERAAHRHVAVLQPLDQAENKAGDTLRRGTSAEIDDRLVRASLFVDPQMRELRRGVWIAEHGDLQIGPVEGAVRDL